jgi:hypothetical protein
MRKQVNNYKKSHNKQDLLEQKCTSSKKCYNLRKKLKDGLVKICHVFGTLCETIIPPGH